MTGLRAPASPCFVHGSCLRTRSGLTDDRLPVPPVLADRKTSPDIVPTGSRSHLATAAPRNRSDVWRAPDRPTLRRFVLSSAKTTRRPMVLGRQPSRCCTIVAARRTFLSSVRSSSSTDISRDLTSTTRTAPSTRRVARMSIDPRSAYTANVTSTETSHPCRSSNATARQQVRRGLRPGGGRARPSATMAPGCNPHRAHQRAHGRSAMRACRDGRARRGIRRTDSRLQQRRDRSDASVVGF